MLDVTKQSKINKIKHLNYNRNVIKLMLDVQLKKLGKENRINSFKIIRRKLINGKPQIREIQSKYNKKIHKVSQM